jgi:aldehyde:ferredoxin oxidoreductase
VAGRRGALLASLRTDDRRNLGRGGLGASLGAKRLVAVAVAGDLASKAADPRRFDFFVYEAAKLVEANPVTSQALPRFGTAVLMQLVNAAGALPVRNFSASSWAQVDAICGETVADTAAVGRTGCFGCRIRCTPRLGVRGDGRGGAGAGGRGQGRVEGAARGREGVVGRGLEGPEYETLWAFGAACGVSDLDAICEANLVCAEYGLDTISSGATVAAAMELGERGALARTLHFGDAPRLLELVREMALGRGFGAELADGSARFAARYGRPQTAMHVKGLELPGYDPRGMVGQGLAYATSNRGACHLRGNMLGPEVLGIPKLIDRREPVGKAGILVNLQHLAAIFDSACLCKFAGFAFGEEIVARLVTAWLGLSLSTQEILRVGERIWNLERLWNLAAGFTAADDTLPARLLPAGARRAGSSQNASDGGARPGGSVPLAPMLAEYYRARGWDEEGRPGPDKLDRLGLGPLHERLSAQAVERDRALGWQGWRPEAEDHLPRSGPRSGDPRPAPGPSKKSEDRHLRAV